MLLLLIFIVKQKSLNQFYFNESSIVLERPYSAEVMMTNQQVLKRLHLYVQIII